MRLFGHRGASFDCPENTRVSFETALENGANGVECDIQLLADGNVVILHDDTLRRTANSPLNAAHESVLDLDVSQLTWEQVQPIDVGAYRGPQWAGQRVLLLEEFLAIVAGHDTACCLLELKGADEAIIQPAIQVAQAAIAAGMAAERLIWISFDLSLVQTIKTLLPACSTYHIAAVAPLSTTAAELVSQKGSDPAGGEGEGRCFELLDQAAAAGIDGVDFGAVASVVTEAVFAYAASRNLQIGLWVSTNFAKKLDMDLDNAANVDLFAACGAQFFTSDLPPDVWAQNRPIACEI